jgi:hypothetical protein
MMTKPSRKDSPGDAEKSAASGAAPHAKTPFDLSGFPLEQITLEIRYPLALTLWDHAGALWRAVQEKWPDFNLVTAEPAKTVFQAGKTAFVVEVKAARIISLDANKSMEEFSTIAREFFRLTALHLRVALYERLGLRLIHFKEYKDRAEAASAFHSLGLIKVPDKKKFEIEEPPVNPQYILRWESEKKGTLIQCRAETRKVDWDPPIESVLLFEPIHKEKNGIVLDIDYYTVAPVEIGQVDMGEWFRHGLHIISRDTRYLFEG